MRALVLNAIQQPLIIEDRSPLQPGACSEGSAQQATGKTTQPRACSEGSAQQVTGKTTQPGACSEGSAQQATGKTTQPDVIVRLKAAALNRRDYWITQGMYPGIKPPVVLGSDGAGIVSAIGEGVESKWMGKEVIINPGMNWGDREDCHDNAFSILGVPDDGTFADEVRVPASQLHPKPEHLDWHQAAALPLAGVTAWRALVAQGRLAVKESAQQEVLITGIGGGVSAFALQFALQLGATVWVTSSCDQKISRAIELGAKGGANYTNHEWANDLKSQGASPRVIIDSAGGAGYQSLIEIAQPGACIVNYGATAGPPAKLDLFKVFWKQLRIQGSTMGSPSDFQSMLDFVQQHQLVPLVDDMFPLEEGNQAIEQMKESAQFGKVVLQIEQ